MRASKFAIIKMLPKDVRQKMMLNHSANAYGIPVTQYATWMIPTMLHLSTQPSRATPHRAAWIMYHTRSTCVYLKAASLMVWARWNPPVRSLSQAHTTAPVQKNNPLTTIGCTLCGGARM